MDSARKQNSPSGPLAESPQKKNMTSSDGFKKTGFLSIFSKKKGGSEFDTELASKENIPLAPIPRTRAKNKAVNRKNVADGRIRLNVNSNDRVPEDFVIEYRDNPFDALDHNASRITSYLENYSGFSEINGREVRQFIENQNKQELAPPILVENLELELLDVARSYEEFLGKWFRFFQGLLAGFCVIHLFLIFAGSDDQLILNSYVLSALRINQIFYVVSLLSAVGSLNSYLETKAKYNEAVLSQPMIKVALGRQATKYLIALVCFAIVFWIMVFNHEFVSKLSDSATILEATFKDQFRVFRVLSALMAAFSLIGWCSLVLAFEEASKSHVDVVNYSEMTADETLDMGQRKL